MDGMILSRLNNLDSEFVAVHGATKASVSRNEGGGSYVQALRLEGMSGFNCVTKILDGLLRST